RDPEFVTAGPNAGHRPRVRHSEKLASLELSQQEAGFNPGVRRERRSLDLAPEPDPGACPSVTHGVIYVRTDMPARAAPNSDVEADVALSRCAPSGQRRLTPVVMPTDVGAGSPES